MGDPTQAGGGGGSALRKGGTMQAGSSGGSAPGQGVPHAAGGRGGSALGRGVPRAGRRTWTFCSGTGGPRAGRRTWGFCSGAGEALLCSPWSFAPFPQHGLAEPAQGPPCTSQSTGLPAAKTFQDLLKLPRQPQSPPRPRSFCPGVLRLPKCCLLPQPVHLDPPCSRPQAWWYPALLRSGQRAWHTLLSAGKAAPSPG